jgi:hypothetical protein
MDTPRRRRRSAPAMSGQSLPEYALTIFLIVLLSHGVIGLIGRTMMQNFVKVDQALGGAMDEPVEPPSEPEDDPWEEPTVQPPPVNTPASPPATATSGPPAATATRTATAGPPTATATRTNTPTNTVSPTRTNTPTNTPSPTRTSTPTVIPSPTATLPPTATPVPTCTVPNLTGKKINTARGHWEHAGFTGSISHTSGSSGADLTYQSLGAGAIILCTSSIEVSSAPMCTVPMLTGLWYWDASSEWDDAGFTTNINFTGSSWRTKTQSIPAGTRIFCSSSITVGT